MKVSYSKKIQELKDRVLERVSTKGLLASGAVLAAIPFMFTLILANKHDNNFEYNNTGSQTLGEAYESFADVDIDDEVKKVLDTLSVYEETDDTYEQISSLADVDVKKESDARKKYKEDVDNYLLTASKEILRLQIIESLGLSNSATIDIKSAYNSEDGVTHVIYVTDGDKKYTIEKIPNEYRSILDSMYELGRYEGNGTGSNWKEQMPEYTEEANRLYMNTLEVASDEAPRIRAH